MDVLVLSQQEVRRLLPMRECIDVMEAALVALDRGDALLPLRQIAELPGPGPRYLAVMPSYLRDLDAAGVKAISIFPRNEGTELDAHQGAVLLFEGGRGRLVAIADATEVTAIRTAAVSGAATRALAREDAGDLAILGSGTQARTHLEAMVAVRPVRRVRVWSRTPERARAFARRESARVGVDVEAVPEAEEAVAGADLVCTTTSAREPVLQGRWLGPGAHVNAVGFAGPGGRELDTEAVVRSRLFADRRESALHESGDVLIPLKEGAIGEDHIVGEIGAVLAGTVEGRRSPEEITVFESMGLAIEDLAAVHHLYRKATETGGGTRVELGGRRHDG